MPAVSKTDALVDETIHLAKILKNDTDSNIGEKSFDQLWWLVDALSNKGTITHNKLAAQKSDTIPETHQQTRVANMEKRTHNPQDLQQKNDGAATTTETFIACFFLPLLQSNKESLAWMDSS